LIWGSADDVFPVSTGQSFSKQIEQAGGKATMTVFEGGHHDFSLKPENAAAQDSYADAIRFLTAQLRR
jgi:dienelactone hydrolase